MDEPNLEIEEVDSEDQQNDPTLQPEMLPISIIVRVAIWTYGIVVPIVCHLLTLQGPPQSPQWQSGQLDDKLGFVLCFKCGWPMYPLLGFAIVCLSMVMIAERHAAKRWVRFGVLTGVPVTTWYLYAFSGSVAESFELLFYAGLSGLVAYGLIWGYRILCLNYGRQQVGTTVGVLFALVVLVSCIMTRGVVFFAPFIYSLVLSTPFALLIYLGMSIWMLTTYRFDRFSIGELLAGMTWLGSLLGGLRASIMLSYEEYSKLPLEPPEGCYIATAAAKGHPALVGSRQLPVVADEPVWVNQQLTTFKLAELTLRVVSPVAHRMLRYFYNRIGPLVAARLSSRSAASLAYLSLKPAEWFCRVVLRILLGRKALRRASSLYFDRAAAAISGLKE